MTHSPAKEQSMVDWTKLERLHLACIKNGKGWWFQDRVLFNQNMAESFPAILAERQAILAKLEAAQRLRDALFGLLDDGVQPRFSTIKRAEDALAAFDKETE